MLERKWTEKHKHYNNYNFLLNVAKSVFQTCEEVELIGSYCVLFLFIYNCSYCSLLLHFSPPGCNFGGDCKCGHGDTHELNSSLNHNVFISVVYSAETGTKNPRANTQQDPLLKNHRNSRHCSGLWQFNLCLHNQNPILYRAHTCTHSDKQQNIFFVYS